MATAPACWCSPAPGRYSPGTSISTSYIGTTNRIYFAVFATALLLTHRAAAKYVEHIACTPLFAVLATALPFISTPLLPPDHFSPLHSKPSTPACSTLAPYGAPIARTSLP